MILRLMPLKTTKIISKIYTVLYAVNLKLRNIIFYRKKFFLLTGFLKILNKMKIQSPKTRKV